MSKQTISGQLLNSNQLSISGLKVSIWDKDKKVSDHLGSTYSDAKGQFHINFDTSKFFDGKEDNLPDIFFLVYQGDKVIHSTEGKPIKNAKDLKSVVLVIATEENTPNNEPTTAIYSLQGSVVQKKNKTPIPNIKVEAWDKDKKVCDQLGLAITDEKGAFYIQYDDSRFKDDPTDHLPDVFFRLYEGEDMIHSTEGKPLKNVTRLKNIHIVIDYDSEASIPKFPNFSRTLVLNFAKNAAHTPNELKKKQPKIYAALKTKAQQELQKLTTTFFEKASYDLKHYAKKIDFADLIKEDNSVKDYIKANIDNSNLPSLTKNEAQTRIAKWENAKTLNELILPENPIKDNPLIEKEKQQSHVFKIAELANLNSKITDKLINKDISLYNISPETINELVEEKVVTKTQGQTLQLNANIYTLAKGNTQLSNAIKNHFPNQKLKSISELIPLEVADWKTVLTNSQIYGDEANIGKLAKIKQKQIELLYPHQVFKERSKKAELPTVKPIMNKFYKANDSLNFLHLNYSLDSEDLDKIDLNNFSEDEKNTILENLKTNQILYNLTKDATDALHLKKHYKSSREILLNGYHEFKKNTGFKEATAKRIYNASEALSVKVNIGMGNIISVAKNPWRGGMIGGTTVEAQSYLRRLNGYEDFFGETDFCNCKHCNSIISPAAYFVDLMGFLKDHVLDIHFIGDDTESILSPKVRRLDLWSGLVFNCENTHELIPYLTIINEILENFIYAQQHDGDSLPSDRFLVENFVYELFSLSDEEPLTPDDEELPPIRSIHQPFHLPLTELELYLQHFPITRASIAEVWLSDVEDSEQILPSSKLNLSKTSYSLIEADASKDVLGSNVNRFFLQNLYKITIPETGAIVNLEVQQLLAVLNITREEFTELFKTQYVFPNSSLVPPQVKIRGGRKDSGLQINVEYIDEIKQFHLDRMHRFIRLYKQLDWSITELDKIVQSLDLSFNRIGSHYLYIEQIIQLLTVQKELNISVEELQILIYRIPTYGKSSFFDKRFNLSSFVKSSGAWEGEFLITGSDGLLFQHPNYRTTTGTTPPTSDDNIIHHRLLAGFGINDEEFFALIQFLIEQLKDDSSNLETDAFKLNTGKLSLIYRHVLLLKRYKLKVEELFFFIRIEPLISTTFLSSFKDIKALAHLIDWYKKSDYTIEELAFVLGESISNESLFEYKEKMAYHIWSKLQTEESLIFTDSIFSFVKGISENQSKAIIKENDSLISSAEIWTYSTSVETSNPITFNLDIPTEINERLVVNDKKQVIGALLSLISEHISVLSNPIEFNSLEGIIGLTAEESRSILNHHDTIFNNTGSNYEIHLGVKTNPNRLNINIPTTIWDNLSPNEKDELYIYFLDHISRYIQDGAPEISDRLFVGIVDLDLEESRAIFTENSSFFVKLKNESKYWLSQDFNLESTLTIPSNIPIPVSEAKNMLLSKYAPNIIASKIGDLLGVSLDKTKVLASISGYNFNNSPLSSQLTNIAQGTAPIDGLEQIIEALQKLSIWFKDKAFKYETLSFIESHTEDITQIFSINSPDDFRFPILKHLKQTENYRSLLKMFNKETEQEALHHILEAYDFGSSDPKFLSVVYPELALLFDTEESMIATLNEVIQFPNKNTDGDTVNLAIKSVSKFKNILDLQRYLGVGPEVLPLFISTDFNKLSASVRAVVTAIRTKYDTEEEWQEKIGPFEDKVRERKRDALTDYLIHTYRFDDRDTATIEKHHWFQTTQDLYNYFLLDTELEGCARTSRVVAGISSLQLYIQRCLLNLEQNEDGTIHIKPNDIPKEQWQWRKNYRVWEANRKVFLYPENYIEPDLRDNKTELFKELESTLLQQDINTQNAEDAYKKYMTGFDEISKLKIAGSYHHLGNMNITEPNLLKNEVDTLHLFGVTSSEPPIYYYRTIENIYKKEKNANAFSVKYNNWEKINLQIPVKKVSPIVYNNKLYILWVEIVTRPENEMIDGSSQFSGYLHKTSVKFSSKQLDGTWQAPQTLKLNDPIFEKGEGIVWDPLAASDELTSVFGRSDSTINNKYLKQILRDLKDDTTLLDRNNHSVTIQTSEDNYLSRPVDLTTNNFKKLLKPQYESEGFSLSELHLKPKDGYSLIGDEWERIFPSLNLSNLIMLDGLGYQLFDQKVDFSNLETNKYALSWGVRPPDYQKDKRLSKIISDGKYFITVGTPLNRHTWTYSSAFRLGTDFSYSIWKNKNGLPNSYNHLLSVDSDFEFLLDIINGTLTDTIIDVEGDLLYLHSINRSQYAIERLNTSNINKIDTKLYHNGINGLLNIQYQKNSLREEEIPFDVNVNEVWNDAQKAIDLGTPDFKGSLGTYFREIFFQIPFLIANHLNSQNKFADAQRWYHYIFNPTGELLQSEKDELDDTTDSLERKRIMANRVWQFIEFRNHTLATWKEQLNDNQAISTYENDPFNPHAIARLRLGAYMKSITMKYIDNLLDWGDHLFSQDTTESINEATLLYSMASEILGQRPAQLGNCDQGENNLTYNAILAKMNSPHCNNFLNGVESEIITPAERFPDYEPVTVGSRILEAEMDAEYTLLGYSESNDESITTDGFSFDLGLGLNIPTNEALELTTNTAWVNWFANGPWIFHIPSFHTSFLKQVCQFCIPPNPDLLAYWDRVEDRLFKIRNCMNFTGVRRQLSLFAPEIDPRLLVRAKAAGLSLDEVLNSTQGDLPPYRFAFLLAKAKEYAGALQGFGGALLGLLEKKSAEELTMMRLGQQDEILRLTRHLRDMEVAASEASLEGLRQREESIRYRKDYFDSLINEGLSEWENAVNVLKITGHSLKVPTVALQFAAGSLALPPSILGFSFTTPPHGVSQALLFSAQALNTLSQLAFIGADLSSLQGGHERREQGWKFSLDQTKNELKEIEKQLVAAEIRRDISLKSRELHEKSIEQHQETYEFYRDRFTNLGLYTWLSTQLQGLFRESYNNAMTLARMAERAYRFERNDDTAVLLNGNYWEASKSGLMAGEKLMNDLRKMELRYMETNTRSMEVDQAFSLTQIDPNALLNLKTTGTCEFKVPELYFDLFYPGQYRRRVKSARLTIPCITGPYSNVSAVLTLKESHIRKTTDDSDLTLVPPSRTTSVATSTAQNDSGVFRLDFRDERYMPFEGAGAVESTWQIELPKTFRTFDYSTINDCILHISYTAEYDTLFRASVEEGIESSLNNLLTSDEFSLPRVFSLRQEFSQTFHQLMHSPEETEVSLELNEKHFPLFLQGRSLNINNSMLIIELDDNGFRNEDGSVTYPETGFALNILGSSTPGNSISSDDWSRDGNILRVDISDTILTPRVPASEPFRLNLQVKDGGALAHITNPLVPSDNSALDDHKIKDVYLLFEYRIV